MKKILFISMIIIVVLLAFACCDVEDQTNSTYKDTENDNCGYSDSWIIEDKKMGDYMMADKHYFELSNVDDPSFITKVNVGKYTYESKNVGDTFTYKYKYKR